MIENIRQFVFSVDFVFVLIVLGFILVVALLFLENRRDNRQLRLLNQKIKDLIAGDYSEVLDMQGSPEITDMTNSINDLSEVTRLTQENLEQETKRLTSILSYMTDGVLATNRRGQIIMINDMASKQLGVDPEEVQNTSILDLLDIADEYDLRDLITKMPELMIDSQDENGEYLSLRVRFALVRRESGFISGLVAVLHDTTEQEKEERERRLFVSNVSHELRTPLTSVKSYLEALDKINSNVKKEFKTISPKLGTLEEYLTNVFDLFISKGKACKRSGFSLTLLAMETAELSPIIAEKCSDILENWRLLLADGLFDRNLPEDVCNPVSEWLFTSIQGALTANRIHKDEAFLYNIKSSIRFVSTASPETLREIFSRSDEDEVVA